MLIEVVENFCIDFGYTFHRAYSGRGMYGERCIGITCHSALTTIGQLTMYLARNGVSDDVINELLACPCSDNMGMGSILYFPKSKWFIE